VFILFEAVKRLRNPPEVHGGTMFLVAAVGLAVNVAGMLILSAGAEESLNIKAAYMEVVSDAISAVGVILAGAVIWTTGWYYADPLISAGIGLFILPRTWTLLREAIGVLLEGTPADVNLPAVREALRDVPGVQGVHDLHVWTLTSGINAISAHIHLASGASDHDVLCAARNRITSRFKIAHVTVQLEREACPEGKTHF
jgi:cobalt-zinc-cadmium efflux system protein